jgi:hypothetical protein
MNYAIFRSEPIYTLNDLAQIGSHNKREKKAYNSNPDINKELTKDNIELVPLNTKYVKGFHELTKEYELEHNERMKNEREDRKRTYSQMLDRSKNVVADEMIFTATHGFFDGIDSKELKIWADTCMEFVYNDLGYKKEQILHATVHLDEKTPHIHCVVVPLVKKLDKRTNTERYTISKKQYIKDKFHLSKLQDKYCERLNAKGFELERGLKGSIEENLSVKEFKKLTSKLENELTRKESKLEKSISNLEEQLKTNKPIFYDKESIKVKKETLECVNQVIEDAKKIDDMKPKLDATFKGMKNLSDNLSKNKKENESLNKEVDNLKLRNEKLENQIAGLKETIDYLQAIVEAIIEFVYELFHNFDIPKWKERDFRKEFHEHIPSRLYKSKDNDDREL